MGWAEQKKGKEGNVKGSKGRALSIEGRALHSEVLLIECLLCCFSILAHAHIADVHIYAQAVKAYRLKQQGDSFASKKDWEAAEQAYTQAMEIGGLRALIRANRAVVRLKQGSAASAVEDAEAACEANLDWAFPQLVASEAHEELGDYENALRCCSNAYSINNELGDNHEFMTRVRWLKDVIRA
mmetsp:Transcript_35654/g.100939  ORF Transcript_35654/g.100939 Transcript_35654/m.100939 type:complete len:184 (-) Transcript_35654:315-866(-)